MLEIIERILMIKELKNIVQTKAGIFVVQNERYFLEVRFL